MSHLYHIIRYPVSEKVCEPILWRLFSLPMPQIFEEEDESKSKKHEAATEAKDDQRQPLWVRQRPTKNSS